MTGYIAYRLPIVKKKMIQDPRCRAGLVFSLLCIVDGWLKKNILAADLSR